MPIDVALVEDDCAVCASMVGILQRAKDCNCVGAFPDAEVALQEIPKLRPAIVLMDINLPGMDGVECVRRLAGLCPSTQFLMLTVHDDPDSIFKSLEAGASGYLLKPVRRDELLAALKDVYVGGAPMTSNIARKVVRSFQRSASSQKETESLTPRETAVLDYLAKGYSYKETAELLGIAYRTVHSHIEHIYQKLHVQSRAQAVARYLGI
jgi:DNA-binding NarL/FixJ family response regulator